MQFVGVFATLALTAKTLAVLGGVLVFLTSPLALISAAIVGIGAGFKYLYKNSEGFRDVINDIKGRAMELLSAFNSGGVGGLLEALLPADLFSKVDGVINNIKTKIGELFSAFESDGVSGLLNALLPPGVVESVTSFVTTIKTISGVALDYLRSKWEQLQPTLAMLSAGFTSTVTTVTTILTTLWSIAGPILSLLWNAIQIVGDVVAIAFNNVIAPAFMFVTKLVSVMWEVVGPIISLLGTTIGVLGQVIKLMWDTVLAPFVDYWTAGLVKALEIVMPVLDTVGSVFETIGGYISTAADKVSDFVSAIKNVKIPDAIAKLGSGAMSLVSKVIPDGTHYGGLGRVPYDGYLAQLHVGERVLTRHEADNYDSVVGGLSYSQAQAGVTNNYSTVNNTASSSTSGSGGGVSIAKLADQIVVREEADIRKIADQLVSGILEKRGAFG